jgi:chaperonin GroES
VQGFRPLHDRVLIRRIEAEEKTPGGIIIPDTAKEKPVEGEGLAVGAGARDETGRIVPLDLKVGDHVLFGKWSGTEVLIGGEERLIMKEADILGVVEGKSRASAKAASPASAPSQHWDRAPALPRLSLHLNPKPEETPWLREKSGSAPRRARSCCAASTSWPMP